MLAEQRREALADTLQENEEVKVCIVCVVVQSSCHAVLCTSTIVIPLRCKVQMYMYMCCSVVERSV